MGMDNAYWIITGLSLVFLLAPIGQANAIFFFSQEELAESHIQKEIFRLEQLRNEFYGSLQNPYDDIEIEQKNNNLILDYYSPNSSEYFLKVIEYFKKVQQINLASQQLDEILRGKFIPNADFYKTELFVKESPKFLINNETSTMKRTDDNFQNYKKEHMLVLEKIRNDRYHLHQENFNENVYQLSDKELKTYEKHLKNFEKTSKNTEKQKQQIYEKYEKQIKNTDKDFSKLTDKETKKYEKQIKNTDKDLNKQTAKLTKNYEKQIKNTDKDLNKQTAKLTKNYEKQIKNIKKPSPEIQDAKTAYESKIIELNEISETTKQDAKTAYKSKIIELTESSETKIQDAKTAYESKIIELTESSETKIQDAKTAYESKIIELTESSETQIQDAKTAYESKIIELTESSETQIQDAKTAYESKIKELNIEIIILKQKVPKLIAIILQNKESAISHNPVSRGDPEFTNLMKNEILLAQKTRDNIIALHDLNTLNPYIIENTTNAEILIENANSIETIAPVQTTKINLVLSWLDQNVVLELQGTLNRNSTNFEDFKLMQANLAQIELHKMLRIENSENTEPSDSEQTDVVISDGPYFSAYDRHDFLFQLAKNIQKIAAEKKFIELFGNEIQNKDFDKRD